MADSTMVAKPGANDMCRVLPTSTVAGNSNFNTQTRASTSTSKNETRSFQIIRKVLKSHGISKSTRDIILQSWRSSTKKQYDIYLRKWFTYCKKSTNPIKPHINEVLQFLTQLYTNGLNYSALNTARSALSIFLNICSNINIHENELISRFMKGCFNSRPSLPRYCHMWDVKVVLDYLHTLKISTLLDLSRKLCILLLLVTGQRCQTIHSIQLNDISFDKNTTMVTIQPNTLLKQSRPGKHLKPMYLKAYEGKMNVCVVKTLVEYLDRTKEIRNSQFLFITTTSPYKTASKSTISRWIKDIMRAAGVDEVFKPHSTRSAATSKASLVGLSLQHILDTAGWSNAKTFATFYQKTIVEPSSMQFQSAVLDT
ncbi:uncharacterized protein LOC127846495 isoform X1 [Dreissena polymorpha]|uniref:uncharacterized protein LOC127846495 isoform X1 n=1 Tax=Dreissena polymorpha TaxID=45954 RepID=UPI002264ACF0|nr:uncharacterized protein LOC127846495 isoform X1 [Dreissena polymorpha]